MVRPRRHRWVRRMPDVDYFKPRAVGLRDIGEIELRMEEYEAVRLKDYEKLDQTTAAKRMRISQPTFHRLYIEAREKIAKAIVEGLAIKIQGGIYKMPGLDRTGPAGQGPMTGRGMGAGAGRGAGMGAGMGAGRGGGRGRFGAPQYCTCPSCGYRAAKQPGVPCPQMRCPKCKGPMIRG